METWKDVAGYEGQYQVSNFGRVRSLKYGKVRLLKPGTNGCGYFQVGFRRDGNRKLFLVHRLVAEAFIPNPSNFPFINHKDENPANNAVWNLEWCTSEYNANYGTRNGRISKAMTGRVVAESTREKLKAVAEERSLAGESNPFYGKHHSERGASALVRNPQGPGVVD